MGPRVSDAWLAELWRAALSLSEAARLTGYRPSWLLRRVPQLRRGGVALRRLPRVAQPEPLFDLLRGEEPGPRC